MTTEAPTEVIAGSHHSRCILCGRRNPMSLRLAFRPTGDGAVTTRLEARPELQGYDGLLHGGMVAALLDGAMTHCLFYRGVEAVTGDLHVRFVRAVPSDEPTEVRAWVLSASPRLYRLRAEISGGGRVLAWGEAKFIPRRPR